MKKNSFFAMALLMISFQGTAKKLSVSTIPKEADIYVFSSSDASTAPIKLGRTPYKADLDEIISKFTGVKSIAIEIRKEGFEDEKIILSATGNYDVDINVKMDVYKKIKTIKEHDILMQELFKVQKLIRARNFSDALTKLTQLEKKHKHFSIIAELKAITYYMSKDVDNALSYFREAFALNPDNVDAYKMKVYLERKLGIDTEI